MVRQGLGAWWSPDDWSGARCRKRPPGGSRVEVPLRCPAPGGAHRNRRPGTGRIHRRCNGQRCAPDDRRWDHVSAGRRGALRGGCPRTRDPPGDWRHARGWRPDLAGAAGRSRPQVLPARGCDGAGARAHRSGPARRRSCDHRPGHPAAGTGRRVLRRRSRRSAGPAPWSPHAGGRSHRRRKRWCQPGETGRTAGSGRGASPGRRGCHHREDRWRRRRRRSPGPGLA